MSYIGKSHPECVLIPCVSLSFLVMHCSCICDFFDAEHENGVLSFVQLVGFRENKDM